MACAITLMRVSQSLCRRPSPSTGSRAFYFSSYKQWIAWPRHGFSGVSAAGSCSDLVGLRRLSRQAGRTGRRRRGERPQDAALVLGAGARGMPAAERGRACSRTPARVRPGCCREQRGQVKQGEKAAVLRICALPVPRKQERTFPSCESENAPAGPTTSHEPSWVKCDSPGAAAAPACISWESPVSPSTSPAG